MLLMFRPCDHFAFYFLFESNITATHDTNRENKGKENKMTANNFIYLFKALYLSPRWFIYAFMIFFMFAFVLFNQRPMGMRRKNDVQLQTNALTKEYKTTDFIGQNLLAHKKKIVHNIFYRMFVGFSCGL